MDHGDLLTGRQRSLVAAAILAATSDFSLRCLPSSAFAVLTDA